MGTIGAYPTRASRGAWHPKLRMLWIENSGQLVLVWGFWIRSAKIMFQNLEGSSRWSEKVQFSLQFSVHISVWMPFKGHLKEQPDENYPFIYRKRKIATIIALFCPLITKFGKLFLHTFGIITHILGQQFFLPLLVGEICKTLTRTGSMCIYNSNFSWYKNTRIFDICAYALDTLQNVCRFANVQLQWSTVRILTVQVAIVKEF